MGKSKSDKKKGKAHGDQMQVEVTSTWQEHAATPPTPADAQAVIQLYDLRREALMRESRNVLLRWQPSSAEDLLAVTSFEHEHNAAFRQVTSYFELAFGLARRGAVHPELIAEWCGEGIFIYSKIEPFLDVYRAAVSQTAFQNAQWVVENTEWGRARLELFRSRAKKAREEG